MALLLERSDTIAFGGPGDPSPPANVPLGPEVFLRGFERFKDDTTKHEERIKSELQSGIIPDTVIENLKLLPAGSEQVMAFQAYMHSIVKRIFGADYDPKQHNFQFAVSAAPERNACIYPGAVPPLVIFTRELLSKFTTDDQLAGILLHELGHSEWFKQIKENGGSNPQEKGCDIWATRMMIRAEFDPRQMEEALRILHSDRAEKRSVFQAVLSPHSSLESRLRDVQDAYATVEPTARVSFPVRRLDAGVIASLGQVEHVSYIERILANSSYAGMTHEQNRDFIREAMTSEFLTLNNVYSARSADFMNLLSTFAESRDPADREHVFELCRFLLNHDVPPYRIQENSGLHVLLNHSDVRDVRCEEYYQVLLGRKPFSPISSAELPELLELVEATNQFVGAMDIVSAAKAAETIVRITDSLPCGSSHILEQTPIKQFTGPSRYSVVNGHVRLTWHDHLDWSRELSPQGEVIKTALARFNLGDHRIPNPAGRAGMLRTLTPALNQVTFAELRLDSDGIVIGLKTNPYERFYEKTALQVTSEEHFRMFDEAKKEQTAAPLETSLGIPRPIA